MADLTRATVAVTGATGFVGSAFVRGLLAAGLSPDRLRCLVRNPATAAAAGLPGASLRRADVADVAALREALAGVDVVVHTAGVLKASGRNGYTAVNVDGAANVAAAVAAVAPDALVVVVSSLAAAGPSVDGSTSLLPADRCRPVSAYGDSKRRGELAFAGLPRRVVVRPPVVYGPGDAATRLLFRQATAPIVVVPRHTQSLSVIHVDDVVEALIAAAEREPPGAVVALDGPQRTDTHALLRAIAAACGHRPRLVPIPLWCAGLAAAAADTVAAITGRTSFFNRDKVRELRAPGWVADGSAARSLLGFRPRVDLAAGLAALAPSMARR